jgi:hypothetical protein
MMMSRQMEEEEEEEAETGGGLLAMNDLGPRGEQPAVTRVKFTCCWLNH